MPKAFIANLSAMPFVNVVFSGHHTLVKWFMLESMHQDAWFSTPMMKASEMNGGVMQGSMPDDTMKWSYIDVVLS